jgi:hypothetical protein
MVADGKAATIPPLSRSVTHHWGWPREDRGSSVIPASAQLVRRLESCRRTCGTFEAGERQHLGRPLSDS